MEQEEEPVIELPNPAAVAKYKSSGLIVGAALKFAYEACEPGKRVVDICQATDEFIVQQLSASNNKGKIEKGVAFPTSISVNNCAGHFSPVEDDNTTLQVGDVVKIDLGAHIDGFASLGAHTTIISENKLHPTTGKKADVVCAAHYALEAALRLLKQGKKNSDITRTIRQIAYIYHVNPLEAVLSHELKRFVIDGQRVIANRETLDQKVEEFEFGEFEAYTLDIVMSTGEGKAKEKDTKTTIYKKAQDASYSLKLQSARTLFKEINQKYPAMPFTIRSFPDKRARLGLSEIVKHDLVYPYPVLYEKPNEFIAQFKATVLVLPSGVTRLTEAPQMPYVTSDYSIEDAQLKALLAEDLKKAKKKRKKPTKKAPLVDEKKGEKDSMDTN